MKLYAIAIDDEPLALDIISEYASRISFLHFDRTFQSAIDALAYIKQEPVDLIFLDIHMEDLSGIQFLDILKRKPMIIFTTAYEQYALKGYELDVIDYLLKPIAFERFLKAAEKALERKALTPDVTVLPEMIQPCTTELSGFFFVKTERRMQKIDYDDIYYIEGQSDYLKIVTRKDQIMALMTFRDMESILPEERFMRIHRSYIVALNKIEYIERERVKIKDQFIPVGDTYKKPFYLLLKKNNYNEN